MAAGLWSVFTNARGVNARYLRTIIPLLALAVLSACSSPKPVSEARGKISVVTTGSVLASIVKSVGGDAVQVVTLVPVGATAETFEPTPREIALLHDAQVLVENGSGYETWIAKLITNAANPHLRTVVLSLGVKNINDNPHLWMDPARARVYAHRVRNALMLADPAHAKLFRKNDAQFERSLRVLQRKIAKAVKTIPAKRRFMIVSHDAWAYYNQRFGLTNLGVIELAPGREPNAQHIASIVRQARRHHVTAIFSEADESPKLAQTIAESLPGGHVVPLYVDSLDTNPAIHDYQSMLWYDTRKIVENLKAVAPPTRPSTPDPDAADLDEQRVTAPPTVRHHKRPVATPDPASNEGDLQ